MKTELQRMFFEVVRENFGFLLADGKFNGPYPKLDAKTGIFTVVFTGTNLALELILDERDEDISCKISRMISGRPTTNYATDAQGRLVRTSLFRLLKAHGIQDRLFTQVPGLTVKEQIPITLGDYARMLQAHAPMVLDDNPDFLNVGKP